MKSHMLLLREVLNDLGTWCCTSTTRDLETITRRVANEGMSFLTISLPAFGRDFERCLDRGQVCSSDFNGYSKSGYLPRFLSGFTSLVFCPTSGLLLDDPKVDAIQSVRQITLMYGKINLPCSDARVSASIRRFVECEKEVRAHDETRTHEEYRDFARLSTVLFGDVFSRVDRKVYNGEIVPKHGPGSTADGLLGNGKYVQTEWTERLERVFTASEYLYPSWSHYLGRDSTPLPITYLEPGAERPVRIVTVPKTLKTPRIIAIEPTCMQYMQQAVLEALMQEFERDDILSDFVGFNDQVPNQHLAMIGSSKGNLATLDLSEASDRVSNQLVRVMSSPWLWFYEALDATRSRKADVPGFGVLRLAKYASMGSALCFPIEAFVFLTLVFLGIQKDLGVPLTRKKDFIPFSGRVRIFGDDIIVPKEHVHTVVTTLQDFGLVVNVDKSFWTGKFRESCGREFYDGEDVSIVRIREELPTRRQDAREIISTVSLRNRLYEAGLWGATRFLDDLLHRLIPMPQIAGTSPALGRHSYLGFDESQRECPDLQRPLVRAFVPTGLSPINELDDFPALLKFFLKRGDQPSYDRDHLKRSGRPKRVNIKLGWYPPY